MKVFHSFPNSELDGTMMLRERFRNNEGIIVKAYIESYDIEELNRQKFVQYTIRLQNKLLEYRIKKRFSDFEKFDASLRLKYPQEIFPQLPEKFYINNFDRSKILLRMSKMERYLNELLIQFESKEPMADISEFIGLKKQDMLSILDVNQSSYQFNTKADLAFVRLIYQTEDLQTNLDELKHLIFSSPPSIKTARIIMKGDKSIKSIIAFAFDSPEYASPADDDQKAPQRKKRFSSFNENKAQIITPDNLNNRKGGLGKPTLTMIEGSKNQSKVSEDNISEENLLGSDSKKYDCYIHFTCSVVLSFILEILDYGKNPHAEIYRSAFREVEIGISDHENFKRHLSAREFTICKINCFQLLKVYKDVCRSSRQINEWLLFSKNEEYRNFMQWYNRQGHSSRKEPIYSDQDQPFPKITQLLLRESLHRDSLFKTMDFFMEKHSLNTLMVDDPKHLSKLNFLISKGNRNELIESLLFFKWSPNIIQVNRNYSIESNKLDLDSDHQLDLYIFSHDNLESKKVNLDCLKVYQVNKGDRTVLLFAPQDIDSAKKTDIERRFWSSKDSVFISVEERDLGFFVDIVEYPEDKNKLLISILLHYSFMDKKNERLILNYKQFVGKMRLVKKYCEKFV